MAKKFLIPFIVACMMMSACAGSMVPVDNNEVSDNFTVDLVSSMNLYVGSSEKLILDIEPVAGQEVDTSSLEVKWVNSNAQVISLSESKSTEVVVTGLSSGDAIVTAMVGHLAAASCRVNVSGGGKKETVQVTGLSISETSKDFIYEEGSENNSFGLIASVETNPATANVTVNWSSTVASVATVTPRGNNATVNVLGPGETDIVASLGGYSAKCRLSVTSSSDPVSISVSLNKQSLSMEVGQSETLVATTKGQVEYVRWQSNNQGVATVDQSGVVKAVSEGTATISVSVSDGNETKTATCLVNVAKSGASGDYDNNLPATLKQKGHIYFHYLRTTDSDYDKWALWIWQSFPQSLEGSLWGANASHFNANTPIKPENLQSTGYMSNAQVKGNSDNTAYVDEYGRIIDVDLKAAFIKGGKTGKEAPLISDWDQTILNKTDLGFLVVDQTKMTGESMWTSDGSGETFIKKLGKKYFTDGEDSYLHVYCVEGNVSNYTTASGKQVVNNPTLTDNTGKYRSTDDQSLLTKDDYKKGVSTSSSFKEDRPGVGYQIFVPSYADSDGDGFGDLRGIINKLDYIKNDVGAEVLWLTPIQESNSYHGYDVTDYYKIDSRFGTLEDYQELLYKAHKLGMKVLMDMVINHTSKSNVLFKKSEAAVTEVVNGKEINYRDMYLWKYKTDKVMVWDQTSTSTTTTLDNYKEVQVDSEDCYNQWFKDGTSDYYYFGKFGSGMAELNYNCQATRDYMTDMCKYWLSFGLDGFRLDAIKHIYLLGELDPSLKPIIGQHTVTYDVGQKHYWNEEMGKYDDVPNDYSYDMEMNVLFWKQFSGSLKASYPNCFLVGENFDGWDKRMAPFYEAIDSQFDFSTFYHLNERKEDAMGNSIEVSLNEYKAYRSDLINGAYTSNHDVARMLNHAAAHGSDVAHSYAGELTQIAHHAEVNSSNAAYANNMARYYAAMTILSPGVSWIYYGDEIGLAGNVEDKVADSRGDIYDDHGNNVDRWYRQPMRWGTTKGQDGVVDYTFGGIEVLWDKYNQTLATVPEQKSNANSMLNYFKALCAVKNDDSYPTYGFVSGTGSINGQEGTAKFDISDGTRTVSVFVNNRDEAVSFSMMGYSLLGCSIGGSANSVPAHGFVVMKK